MKKTLRKFVSILSVFVLVFSLTSVLVTHAAAVEDHMDVTTISEYEYITSIRTMSKEKLSEYQIVK